MLACVLLHCTVALKLGYDTLECYTLLAWNTLHCTVQCTYSLTVVYQRLQNVHCTTFLPGSLVPTSTGLPKAPALYNSHILCALYAHTCCLRFNCLQFGGCFLPCRICIRSPQIRAVFFVHLPEVITSRSSNLCGF